jgi:hypothetical protein
MLFYFVLMFDSFFIFLAAERHAARGIAAEPPSRDSGEGDGADSPTPRSGGSPNGILLRKIQLKIKN